MGSISGAYAAPQVPTALSSLMGTVIGVALRDSPPFLAGNVDSDFLATGHIGST